MRKIALIILLTLLVSVCFSQGKAELIDSVFISANQPSYSTLNFVEQENCNAAEIIANRDIKNGIIQLFIQGGISPFVISTDKRFERKFALKYYDFGCTGPSTICLKKYNVLMFVYLSKKFGNQWVYAVRRDVVGLTEWVAAH